jgi:hypothetical protein
MGKLASISLIVMQMSVCIASIVFTVDFLDHVVCSHGVASLCGRQKMSMLGSFIISIPIVMIENLSCFSYVSLFAIMVILTSGSLALTAQYAQSLTTTSA